MIRYKQFHFPTLLLQILKILRSQKHVTSKNQLTKQK